MIKEWENEPDELFWIDEETGYECLILRIPESLHLCGYVKVPKINSFHEVYDNKEIIDSKKLKKIKGCDFYLSDDYFYDTMKSLFNVHEGITFSGEITNREGWWFGFDCAHTNDYCPYLPIEMLSDGVITYKNMQFVKNECKKLAKQLKELGESK